jgi:MFS family permease
VLIFTSINVAYGAYQGLFRPMILALTADSESTLGLALAAVSVGSVAGGFLMTIWNGPKNRIPLILLSWSVMSVFGFVIAGLGRTLPVWLIARFCAGIFSNIALALAFSIWQDEVEESIQGRVFSIIRLLVQVSIPISAFLTALLADYIVEPAMQPGGALTSLFGWLVGTGSGAGFLMPAIRNADRRTPAAADDDRTITSDEVLTAS